MKKIVIELHEDDYNRIMDYGLILEGDRKIFADAIKNGRPLDDYLFPFKDNKKGDNDDKED